MLNLESSDFTNYVAKQPFPYMSKDDILDENFAKKCQEEILNIPDEKWDRYSNPFENKNTLRDKHNLPPHCNQLFDYLVSDKFVRELSEFVQEDLYIDPTKQWWGIHTYNNGDFLDIHSDAGLHPTNKLKKHLTLGIYLSKNWTEKNGGYLEIWDGTSINSLVPKLNKCVDKFLPKFNSLILFNCTNNGWHGNPEPIVVEKDEKRIFVTISYLSKNFSKNYSNKLEKAFFIETPHNKYDSEKEKLRNLRCQTQTCKSIYNINHAEN